MGFKEFMKCGVKSPFQGTPSKALRLAQGKADLWNLDRGLELASPESY